MLNKIKIIGKILLNETKAENEKNELTTDLPEVENETEIKREP